MTDNLWFPDNRNILTGGYEDFIIISVSFQNNIYIPVTKVKEFIPVYVHVIM